MLTTKSTNFDKLLICAIGETLNMLGTSAKQSIYFYLETKFSVTRNEILRNLQKFQGGLEEIFGAGAQFIENSIMKDLHTKMGLPLVTAESEQLEFIEYLDAAKQSYLEDDANQTFENQPCVPALFPFFTVSVSTP